jgi:hypothetical protein
MVPIGPVVVVESTSVLDGEHEIRVRRRTADSHRTNPIVRAGAR